MIRIEATTVSATLWFWSGHFVQSAPRTERYPVCNASRMSMKTARTNVLGNILLAHARAYQLATTDATGEQWLVHADA